MGWATEDERLAEIERIVAKADAALDAEREHSQMLVEALEDIRRVFREAAEAGPDDHAQALDYIDTAARDAIAEHRKRGAS
jgi:vacuolar-type H+-ATPase subunit E/Vma4